MIRIFARRISTALHLFPEPPLLPQYVPFRNEVIKVTTKFPDDLVITTGEDNGYRILIDICHDKQIIHLENDMSEKDKIRDLPRIVETFGYLYPSYSLQGDAQ
jgi:hypothetical protein|tara:strand:- start:3294 stop:3602 length:309 start_codon:yes stop_codon:yes gene_type:complete